MAVYRQKPEGEALNMPAYEVVTDDVVAKWDKSSSAALQSGFGGRDAESRLRVLYEVGACAGGL